MTGLSRGERILVAAGALLFLSSFIDMWATVEFRGTRFGGELEDGDGNAWEAYGLLVRLGLLVGALAVALPLARAFAVAPQLPASFGLVYTAASAFTTLTLLVGAVAGPEGESIDFGPFGVQVQRGVLLVVGIVLAAVMTYGGYAHMQSESPAREEGRGCPPSSA